MTTHNKDSARMQNYSFKVFALTLFLFHCLLSELISRMIIQFIWPCPTCQTFFARALYRSAHPFPARFSSSMCPGTPSKATSLLFSELVVKDNLKWTSPPITHLILTSLWFFSKASVSFIAQMWHQRYMHISPRVCQGRRLFNCL